MTIQVTSLAITNIVFNIGALVGISLWTSTNDIYTSTDSYEFYWFVTIISNIIGILGYFYHATPYIKKHIKPGNSNYVGYLMFIISIFNFVFWLSAASSTTVVLRNCIELKQKISNFRFFTIFEEPLSELNIVCNGEIISVVFGYLQFLLWSAILIAIIHKIITKYNESNIENNIVIQDLEYVFEPRPQIEQEQRIEQQQVTEEQQIEVVEEQATEQEQQVEVVEEQVNEEQEDEVVEEQEVTEHEVVEEQEITEHEVVVEQEQVTEEQQVEVVEEQVTEEQQVIIENPIIEEQAIVLEVQQQEEEQKPKKVNRYSLLFSKIYNSNENL